MRSNYVPRGETIEGIDVPGATMTALRRAGILMSNGKEYNERGHVLADGATTDMLATAVMYLNGGLKAKLTEAFKALRKQGYAARQSFSCCGSCAGCEIATEAETRRAKGLPDWRGAVFYTKQGREDVLNGAVYLAFGQIDSTKFGKIGVDTVTVGVEVCKSLSDAGLHWEWSSDASEKILVCFPRPQAKKEAA